MTKKFLSVILALVLSVSSVFIINYSADAATKENATYDPEKALAYAEKNWDSGVGLCAEFVTRCIMAGGVDVFEKRVVNLYNALNGKYGIANKLILTGGTSGYLKWSDNADKVSAGDPIFYYCNVCKKFQHAVLCNGANDKGYIQDYAHNNAHNGKKQTCSYTDTGCGYSNWTIYAIDLYESPKIFGKKTNVGIPKVTSVLNSSNGIKINWTKIDKADSYNLYRKTESSDWKKVTTLNTTSYTDQTLQNGVKYFYTVRAVKNNILSQYLEGESVVALVAPKVKVSEIDKGVNISWNMISNADGYIVYKAVNNKWVKLATVNASTFSYQDKNVEHGVSYRYTVKAFDGNITGSYSSVGDKITYLTAPVLYSVSNSASGVQISFSSVKNVFKYNVYRKSPGDKDWSYIASTKSNEFTDTTGKNGVTYLYTVRSVGYDGSPSVPATNPMSLVYAEAVAPTSVKDSVKATTDSTKNILMKLKNK